MFSIQHIMAVLKPYKKVCVCVGGMITLLLLKLLIESMKGSN